METVEKFCPVCKNKIERLATICCYCGAVQENYYLASLTTFTNTIMLKKDPANTLILPNYDSMIPDDGIAIYIADALKPVCLRVDKDLVLGRGRNERSQTACLDLSEMGGYEFGLSRRHAMICRGEDGYEIVDLASTNGSWLNYERLTPNKRVPLPGKSQVRLGNLKLLVLHNANSKIESA